MKLGTGIAPNGAEGTEFSNTIFAGIGNTSSGEVDYVADSRCFS